MDERMEKCRQCNYSATPEEVYGEERKHFHPHAHRCVRCGFTTETRSSWPEAVAEWNRRASPPSAGASGGVTDAMVEAALSAYVACTVPDASSPRGLRWSGHSDKMRFAIQAALSHAPVASPAVQWQDIETAPKDGTEILATGVNQGGGRFNAIVKWHGDWMLFDIWDDAYCVETSGLTHWQPLPSPPNTNQEGGG